MFVLGLILLVGIPRIQTVSVCVSKYNGRCQAMYETCPAGHMETLNHCGLLQTCCYPATPAQTGNQQGSTSLPNITTPSSATAPILKKGTCGDPRVTSDHRIVGGVITNHGAYPWQVSMHYRGQHVCGGTLINDRWIVSAAHCFAGGPLTNWTMGLGLQDLHQSRGHMYPTSNIIVHQDYNSKVNRHDIAMVKLAKSVDIHGTYVRPLCLPKNGDNFDNLVCTATGWGSTVSGGDVVTKLREVDLAIIPNDECEYFLPGDVLPGNICAGYDTGDKDTCQGDSGGPLACPTSEGWKLAGIVSWGYGCAEKKSPGLYTRVESYLDWIHHIVAKHP